MGRAFVRRQKHRIDLWSAHVETYLTTRSFLILFLIAYIILIGLFFFWGFYKQFKLATDGTEGVEVLPCARDGGSCNVMRYFISIARGGGFVLNITTALVILLAAKLTFTLIRETPLQLVMPLDDSFPFFHVVVGYTIIAAVAIHGVFHLVWLAGWGGFTSGWFGFTMSTATGFILLTNFSIMLFFARRKERREHFRRFYTVHIIGAIIFFSILFVHGLFYTEPETYKWILGPLLIYLADRGLRYFRTKSSKVTITNDNFVLPGHGIIALKLPKTFPYRAGQYAELKVPAINSEWHPFTIASAPHEDEMHFFIKSLGDWTNALENLLKERLENPEKAQEPLSISVMGPYGAPAQHVRSYHRVILVSGGVGSTPFSSICKHLHHLQVSKEKPVVDSRTDTAVLQNINHRLLEKLADLYDIDLKDLCKAVPEEKHLSKAQHLVSMANMLGMDGGELNSSSTEDSGDGSPKNEGTETDESPMQSNQDSISPSEQNGEQPPPPSAYDDMEAGVFKHVGSVFYDIMSPGMAKKSGQVPHGPAGSVEKLKEEQVQKHTMKGRLTSIYSKRSNLLAFAHTTRVSFTMLLSLLIRGTLICIGLIIGSISLSSGEDKSAQWLITTDTVLGILLACQVTGTVFLEVTYMGKSFFTSTARILDLIVLVPIVILSTAFGIRTWATDDLIPAWYINVHFFVVLPVLFLMLGYRLYRSVGSHTLLRTAPSAGKYKKIVPAVDFMWTTPHDDDDKWLREELNPLATGSELRLHRFVTRAKEAELSRDEGYISSTKSGYVNSNCCCVLFVIAHHSAH